MRVNACLVFVLCVPMVAPVGGTGNGTATTTGGAGQTTTGSGTITTTASAGQTTVTSSGSTSTTVSGSATETHTVIAGSTELTLSSSMTQAQCQAFINDTDVQTAIDRGIAQFLGLGSNHAWLTTTHTLTFSRRLQEQLRRRLTSGTGKVSSAYEAVIPPSGTVPSQAHLDGLSSNSSGLLSVINQHIAASTTYNSSMIAGATATAPTKSTRAVTVTVTQSGTTTAQSSANATTTKAATTSTEEPASTDAACSRGWALGTLLGFAALVSSLY